MRGGGAAWGVVRGGGAAWGVVRGGHACVCVLVTVCIIWGRNSYDVVGYREVCVE